MKGSILGLVPARGGSKGVPRKNIKMLAGKPLIAWTIEAALQSKGLSRVLVSTEDEEIARVARECGVDVPFMRPAELAQDETPGLPVQQHALNWLATHEGYVPDAVMTLQPTSPFRRPEHIDEAVELMLETEADSIVSLCLTEHSPFWMKRLEGNRVYPFLEQTPEYSRRQDLPQVYRMNGAVFLTRTPVLREQNRELGEDVRAIIMDPASSIDIDTPLDFEIADSVMRERIHAMH